MRLRHCIGVLTLFMLVASCTQKKETVDQSHPEKVVQEFVRLSTVAKKPSDKKGLENLCQGPMRQAFEKMSPEQFQVSYLRNHLKIQDFLILGTEASGDEALVKYRVLVENSLGTDPTEEANEREVELIRIDGKWYLELIRPTGQDQIAFTRGVIL